MPSSFLAALLTIAAAPAQQPQQNPPIPVLNVSGNAEVRVDPDIATVRIGVVSQARTAKEAQNDANKRLNAFLAQARALLGKGGEIETGRIALYPVYDMPPDRPDKPFEQRIIAYRAENTLVARITDFSKVGDLVDLAVSSGLNNIESIIFGLKEDAEPRSRALQQAVREATQKAEAMADAAGVELAGIWSIDEANAFVMPYEGRAVMAAGAADMAPTPVLPGQVAVNANVSMRFFIRPKRR
jgi:uncharacterized protein